MNTHNQALVDEYRQGKLSGYAIAQREGITRQRMSQLLIEAGVDCEAVRRARVESSRDWPSPGAVAEALVQAGAASPAARALGMAVETLRARYADVVVAFEVRWAAAPPRCPVRDALLVLRESGATWRVVAAQANVRGLTRRDGKAHDHLSAHSMLKRYAARHGLPVRACFRRIEGRPARAAALRESGLAWAAVARQVGYRSAGSARRMVGEWRARNAGA